LFESKRKTEDAFRYLENLFREVVEGRKRPVLVIDELQVIRKVINATGQLVLDRLFNFMVRLTKETHLCHCLCATSDCLFIEDVYSNARLEGRAKYLLVDDLGKEDAFRVYEKFGFEDKKLVWDYIGGKVGDMVMLFEEKKQGYSDREALERMLEDQMSRLRWMLRLLEEGEKEGPPVEEVKESLKMFKESEEVEDVKMKSKVLKFLIEENILFYNPVKGIVRPQSQLIHKAIVELCKCVDG
jgi:AAA+ ATPase superfamily predicted ATPase